MMDVTQSLNTSKQNVTMCKSSPENNSSRARVIYDYEKTKTKHCFIMHCLCYAKSCVYANHSFGNINYQVKPYCTEEIQPIITALRGPRVH